jgi:DNA modification methylase
MRYQILTGDCRATLATLPVASVQCCVTSPPYWGLRDYGTPEQIGLESTPDAYVAALVDVFQEVRRVLADDGVLWLNLGDSYVSVGGTHDGRDDNQPGVGAKRVWRDGAGRADGVVDERGQRNRNGVTLRSLPAKNLIGIPWRVAFALQADGWYLRSDVIWAKPNPMPESVTDRPTKSHEYVFLLSKSERYYYDAAAIAEPAKWERWGDQTERKTHPGTAKHLGNKTIAELPIKDSKNARTVWNIATQAYSGAHFAVMPEALATRCVLAGSRIGDTVFDPFAGAGTTGVAALSNGRSFIGCEANAAYVAMADTRLRNVAPLFTHTTA